MVLIKIPPLDEIKNDDFSEVYLSYNQCTACGNKQLKKKMCHYTSHNIVWYQTCRSALNLTCNRENYINIVLLLHICIIRPPYKQLQSELSSSHTHTSIGKLVSATFTKPSIAHWWS